MRYDFKWRWLPEDQLDEALECPDAADRVVGGFIRWHHKEIQFICGDLITTFRVPFDWFETCGDGIRPDFEKLAFDDHGGTIALGKYEVSESSILYDFDPEYRRRQDEAKKPTASTLMHTPRQEAMEADEQ
ncbi:MAG: hypothetical protein P4L67_04335 [Candidatus Pacebacteria bacterium]|nr:hypothetical protein [Candidatus Paceibacterota bacterium]